MEVKARFHKLGVPHAYSYMATPDKNDKIDFISIEAQPPYTLNARASSFEIGFLMLVSYYSAF